MIFVRFCNGVCWICVFWIYCHLWRNSCMMRICSVVCLSSSSMCLSFCGMMSYAVWGLVKGSRVTSVRITATVTPISRVMGARSRSTESVPIPMVMVVMPGVIMTPRCWSIMPTSVVVPASCWCAWRWDFVGQSTAHVHNCYSQSIWCEGNSMPCGQFLGIGNIYHHH